MKDYPHRYVVRAAATGSGDVAVAGDRLPTLATASPAEFDGPGDRWSPETLLAAAVGDCFILTFRAVAAAGKLPWVSLECEVAGTLDRVERVAQFTAFELDADLAVPAGTDAAAAERALAKAERYCLISQSLKAAVHLRTRIRTLEHAVTRAG